MTQDSKKTAQHVNDVDLEDAAGGMKIIDAYVGHNASKGTINADTINVMTGNDTINADFDGLDIIGQTPPIRPSYSLTKKSR